MASTVTTTTKAFNYTKLLLDECEEVDLTCEYCDTKFSNKVNYMAHIDHHMTGDYICSDCQFIATRICTFYAHACYSEKISYCVFCEQFSDHSLLKSKDKKSR